MPCSCRFLFKHGNKLGVFFLTLISMKKILAFTLFFLLMLNPLIGQPERIGAGLSFSNKRTIFFPGPRSTLGRSETGNPGLVIRTWVPVNKRMTIHAVPSITGYYPLTISNEGFYYSTAYMLAGDLDFQFQLFHEKTLKLVAFAGANYTWIFTHNKENPDFQFNLEIPENDEISGFGPSAGAALEMRMSPFIDFILSGKFTYSFLKSANPETTFEPVSVPVIQVQAVYYFQSRGKGYYRK